MPAILPKRLLYATDLSPASERACEAALELAKALDADLTVLFVLEPPPYPYPISIAESTRVAVEEQLDRVTDALRKEGVRAERCLREGSPANEIVGIVEENGLELVIVGTHGRKGISHWLLGSVAERVVRLSPAPVLTVPSWRYADRREAGLALARELEKLRDERPLVFALSRGAIPVAHEVARALEVALEVLVVGELECDGAAVGAVSEEGTVVVDHPKVAKLKVALDALGTVTHDARQWSRDEAIKLRGARWIGDVTGRAAVVVGDGSTTDWPFAVAAEVLRASGATRVIAASPAFAGETGATVSRDLDEWIGTRVDSAAKPFLYRDKREPSDAEANALLES